MRILVEQYEVRFNDLKLTGRMEVDFAYFWSLREAFRFMKGHPGSTVRIVRK